MITPEVCDERPTNVYIAVNTSWSLCGVSLQDIRLVVIVCGACLTDHFVGSSLFSLERIKGIFVVGI